MTPVLWMPFASSVLYVFSVMMLKRSAQLGVGVWRTAFVTNLLMAGLFGLLFLFGGAFPGMQYLWQPAVAGCLLVGGQVLTFAALETGDVSVATPVLGIKTVLVAVFTSLVLSDAIPVSLWSSAVLSALAIWLLNQGKNRTHRHVSYTAFISFLAATCYALFDVLVQKWSPTWGVGRFLPVMFGFVGLISLVFIPFFKAPLKGIRKEAWTWLLSGGFVMGIQGILLISAISLFGEATRINVVYSVRGLWSVLAVWLIGHWFGNTERAHAGGDFGYRFAGAAVLFLAIILALKP